MPGELECDCALHGGNVQSSRVKVYSRKVLWDRRSGVQAALIVPNTTHGGGGAGVVVRRRRRTGTGTGTGGGRRRFLGGGGGEEEKEEKDNDTVDEKETTTTTTSGGGGGGGRRVKELHKQGEEGEEATAAATAAATTAKTTTAATKTKTTTKATNADVVVATMVTEEGVRLTVTKGGQVTLWEEGDAPRRMSVSDLSLPDICKDMMPSVVVARKNKGIGDGGECGDEMVVRWGPKKPPWRCWMWWDVM